MHRLLLVLLLLTISAPPVRAQREAVEPGELEARDRAPHAPLITQWTHPASEVRGVWIASRDMLRPKDELRQMLDALAAANFSVVLIDTLFRGYVAYPDSEHLRHFPEFNGEDMLGWFVEECRARGLRTAAWMEYGFYAYFTADATKDPSMGAILDRHPELLSVNSRGTRIIHRSFGDFYSMCPSNPLSHEILGSIMAETVSRYPVDELNLDRIRYAAADYCYCNYCKIHFERDTGIALAEFADGTEEARQWLEWKRQQTTKAVQRIRALVHAARPGLPITAYVVGPEEMDDKAQGWDLWMQHDLLEGIAVSMYGANIESAAARARELLGPRQAKLIGAISAGQAKEVYLSNIQRTRQLGMMGQYSWHFGDLMDDLEALKVGPYAKPARSPLHE
jgi:uncharacterized lipoprotein YddW (UPF0748 family)